MSLLTFPPGWNLDIPAGTLLIRADVVMNTRPGAGGYCAIIEASDVKDLTLLRGGEPESDTEKMMRFLAVRLAEEIGGNRALVLTRGRVAQQALAEAFKPWKMIRFLGHSNAAVADATRHAAVMAERSYGRTLLAPGHPNYMKVHEERLQLARYEPNGEAYNENQDVKTVHAALQHLVSVVGFGDLKNPRVQQAAQQYLNAAENERLAHQQFAIRAITANDIPKPTRDKESRLGS
ncbi:hypothetical protein [Sphingosinicella sp. BN140058]|uniref:hypothetical protein n=1 Tax=Sphingosinicella sp. BN140058 TaxID=1892855 RepID=UPI0010137ADB|nr:hypothetical protein [Sphingosinicella sp. BN140058]QAY80207.1 hypothetical protein ETR14_26555 [Sphingosinicella sp. BN140058]